MDKIWGFGFKFVEVMKKVGLVSMSVCNISIFIGRWGLELGEFGKFMV